MPITCRRDTVYQWNVVGIPYTDDMLSVKSCMYFFVTNSGKGHLDRCCWDRYHFYRKHFVCDEFVWTDFQGKKFIIYLYWRHDVALCDICTNDMLSGEVSPIPTKCDISLGKMEYRFLSCDLYQRHIIGTTIVWACACVFFVFVFIDFFFYHSRCFNNSIQFAAYITNI